MRSRELYDIPKDAPIDGLIIPDIDQGSVLEDKDKHLEVLGMERLYSAVAHLEQSPTHMVHLFHAIGKAFTESDKGMTNGSYRRLQPLPKANRKYVCYVTASATQMY